jgi:hypothetical protein
VPIPPVASFAELNTRLLEHRRRRLGDRLRGHDETIGERLVRDRAAFLPLPATPTRPARRRLPKSARVPAVLERFRADYNRRFAVSAADPAPAWRKLRPGIDLARVCSFGYQATVLNDNTVRLGGVVIDIPPGPRQRGYAHSRVEVRQLLDGSWRVYYDDRLIATAAPSNGAELRALKARRRWAGRATGPARFGQLTAGPPADPLASS